VSNSELKCISSYEIKAREVAPNRWRASIVKKKSPNESFVFDKALKKWKAY